MLPLLPPAPSRMIRLGLVPAADAELIRRFASGKDEAAFAELVNRHGPMVLGVARRVVGDHHVAEDVLQAPFLALACQAGHLRPPDALPAWLHQTARNLGLKAVRGRKRQLRAETGRGLRASGPPPVARQDLDDLSAR